MRITVEIDDKTLKAVISATGENRKSPAVAKALKEFLRRTRLKKFADMIRSGELQTECTNEEIEQEDC